MSPTPELPGLWPILPESNPTNPLPAGPLPAGSDEARRFERYRYRSRVEATIHSLGDDPKAPPVRCAMLSRDLSRGGINLLHSEQLFPSQKIEIVLSGATRWVEVMWCRRLANRCFSAGCRFVTKDGLPEEKG